jgi:hypothetical protein
MTQLFVDTLANEAGTGPTELTKQSAAKAWAKATAAGVLQEGLNISSITSIATGNEEVAFSNNMNTTTYSGTVSIEEGTARIGMFFQPSVGDFQVICEDETATRQDQRFCCAVHGTLA